MFWILKEDAYHAQNGINGPNVRSGDPLLLRTCFRGV